MAGCIVQCSTVQYSLIAIHVAHVLYCYVIHRTWLYCDVLLFVSAFSFYSTVLHYSAVRWCVSLWYNTNSKTFQRLTLYGTVQYSKYGTSATIQINALRCTGYSTVYSIFSTAQYCTAQCSTAQHSTVQYSTLIFYAVLYCVDCAAGHFAVMWSVCSSLLRVRWAVMCTEVFYAANASLCS